MWFILVHQMRELKYVLSVCLFHWQNHGNKNWWGGSTKVLVLCIKDYLAATKTAEAVGDPFLRQSALRESLQI